jgi:thiamine kinase-like enzyme
MPDDEVRVAAVGRAAAADLERAVRAALGTDSCTRALAAATLTVQPGGLSNHAWIAAAAGERFFVRLSPPDAERFGVDRDAECGLLHIVANAGFAPYVIRCDPARRLLVTRLVPGHSWQRDEAIAPHNIARLAQSLRGLHSLPMQPGMRTVDFAVQAAHLEAQCAGASPVDNELRGAAMEVLAALGRGAGPETLCHNDLHHLNLIDAGDRLWLVDWEYGGAGDPVFDLASFLCQHDCGPREQSTLLEAYGKGGRINDERVTAARWAFDYVQWLWYRAWPDSGSADPVYTRRAAAIEQRLRRRTR